jgi:hypothetical protein
MFRLLVEALLFGASHAAFYVGAGSLAMAYVNRHRYRQQAGSYKTAIFLK